MHIAKHITSNITFQNIVYVDRYVFRAVTKVRHAFRYHLEKNMLIPNWSCVFHGQSQQILMYYNEIYYCNYRFIPIISSPCR